ITGILFFVARPRLLAAGALHQYAAALAVRNQRALASGLERLFLARRFPLLALLRPVEFCAGLRDHLLAKLLAQHAGLHFLGLAFLDLAELERAVGHADQPIHLEPEMRHHIAHLAVLALADRKHQPDIGALVALQRGVDRPVFDAVDLDAILQLIELRLRHLAVGANAVAPEPAGIRQFQHTGEPTIIGEQQKPLGVEIEPSDRDQPWQAFRQIVEHGRPPLGVGMRRHQSPGLVIEKQPRAFARRQRLSIDHDHVVGGDVERRRVDDAAVDGDAALRDHLLGIAARGKARARQCLCNALTGFLRLYFLARGAPVEIGLPLAVGAAAAKGRTLREDLAVVLIVAARTIGETAFAARMAIVAAAAGLLIALEPGAAEFGAIFTRVIVARTREARPPVAIVAWPVVTGLVEFRPVGFSLAIAARRTLETFLALLPGLRFTARRTIAEILVKILAKILARAAIPAAVAILGTTGEFALAAKLPLGPIAVARRPRAIGAIPARPVAAPTKIFAARRIRAL